MKNFLRSPEPIDGGSVGGGDRVIASSPASTPTSQPQTATNPNNVPSQFKEGTMPSNMKGMQISFDGSDPDVSAVTPVKDDEAGVEFNKETQQTEAKETVPAKAKEQTPAAKDKTKLAPFPEIKKEVTPEVKSPTPEQTKEVPKGQRDYSIFTPEEQAVAKATSNQQFALIEKLKKDSIATKEEAKVASTKLQELEANPNAIPKEWYNHPDAYVLHPQYQNAQILQNRAGFEAEHYKNQVIAIESGSDYVTVKGYNQSGNPVFSEPIKPDASAKVNCLNLMNTASTISQQYGGAISQLQQSFKNDYNNQLKVVEDIVADKWPWVKDTKDARHNTAKDFMNVMPQSFSTHPMTKVASLLYTTVFDLAKALDDARAQAATGKKVAEIQREVEPTVSSVASPDSGNTKKGAGKNGKYPVAEFNLEGMLN